MLPRALDTTRKRVVATAILLALLIGGLAVLFAGQDVDAAAPTATVPPTTTTTEATTTTVPLPLAPLTGLPDLADPGQTFLELPPAGGAQVL